MTKALTFITLTYLIETAGSPERLAAKIASDQSTGTFVPVPGETEELKDRVAARVAAIRPLPSSVRPSYPSNDRGPFHRAEADIAFPFDAIGTDLSALMTIAIGGVYSIKGFTGIRVVDMKLPPAFGKAWPDPQFGVAGSRRLAGVEGRPIIGRKVMYAWGISATDPDEMMRNHDIVLKAGGNCAVININSIGMGGMSFLRKRSSLVLHAHRNGWDVLTRHRGVGMDFKVWQQFWRLLGVDQFQINGIRAKYWEPDESFVQSFKAVSTPLFAPDDCPLPVAGSGQWGGQAHDTYERTGRTLDLMYLCGGGIVSHPGGPGAGVKAVKQAWEAAVLGVPLEVYAREHKELAQSIATFADGKGA